MLTRFSARMYVNNMTVVYHTRLAVLMPRGRPRAAPQPPAIAAKLVDAKDPAIADLAVGVSTLRFERGWNRNELASVSGLHPRQIAEIEAGKRDPQLTSLVKLADALECDSIAELLFSTEG